MIRLGACVSWFRRGDAVYSYRDNTGQLTEMSIDLKILPTISPNRTVLMTPLLHSPMNFPRRRSDNLSVYSKIRACCSRQMSMNRQI